MTGANPQDVDQAVRTEIIELVRRFVAHEVIPAAPELERSDTFPSAIVEQMKELGLFGVTIPEAYGGLGLDLLTYIGVIEELSYGWMSLTGIVNTHTMAATLIMAHGTEEQKQRWLPAMASGAKGAACHCRNPTPAVTPRNLSCRARRDGEEYVLNGTKAWVTNGERAAIVALAARSEEGISAFIVEKEPGPQLRRHLGQQEHRASWATGAWRRWRWPMPTTTSRPPTSSARPVAGSPRFLSVLEVGRINIAREPSASHAPPSMRRSPTPSGARRWANPSASTRPSR